MKNWRGRRRGIAILATLLLMGLLLGCGQKDGGQTTQGNSLASEETSEAETFETETLQEQSVIQETTVETEAVTAETTGLSEDTEAPETTAESTPVASSESTAQNGWIVAIDPGHQAHGNSETEPNGPGSSVMKAKVTSGTQGKFTGIPEYVINLEVALQLKTELLARGYQVVMTRETHEVNLSNAERAAIASTAGADIFLRIHCNGSTDASVNGIVTMSPSAQNPYVSRLYSDSYRLSALLADNMCQLTGARNMGVLETDTMSGINWSTMPVSIIEMGFMSNETEDRALADPGYQALLVQGMANGVDAYFNR